MTRRVLALALIALAFVACGNSSHVAAPRPAPSVSAQAPICAVTFVRAMTSPGAVIPGAFDCMSADYQAKAAVVQITSDATLEAYAQQDPVFTSYVYAGHEADTYYFTIKGASGVACLTVVVDAKGKADGGGLYRDACPSTLPQS